MNGGTSNNCTGGCGTVFRITSAGTLTTLYSFSNTDGSQPDGLIQATDGNFYGETSTGGTNGIGTIFKMIPSGTLTILHEFDFDDGERPFAALVEATDGNLDGTTLFGGRTPVAPIVAAAQSSKLLSLAGSTTLYSFGVPTASPRCPGSYKRPTETSTGQQQAAEQLRIVLFSTPRAAAQSST